MITLNVELMETLLRIVGLGNVQYLWKIES